jgi:hypothetical protein
MLAFLLGLLAALVAVHALGADDSRVKEATQQVESGARMIGDGKVGQGVAETARGIGHTVVEGAKFTGEKLKESGKAAEPHARTTWENFKGGAAAFGATITTFFSRLFSDD